MPSCPLVTPLRRLALAATWCFAACASTPALAQEAIVSEGSPTEEPPQSIVLDVAAELDARVEEAPPQERGEVPIVAEPARAIPHEEQLEVIEEIPPPPEAILLHGFRLGYLYIFNTNTRLYGAEPDSQIYADRYDMRAPHLFMVGYELVWRMIGYDWLNLLFIGNIMFAGFEQARFFPSANLMVGFEIARTAQIGIGVSVTPTKEEPAHIVIGAGWTPRVGSFYIPIHAFFVPDIEGHHKIGITAGITFF